MDLDAKINIQINGKSSFWNKRYKVYVNDNFVGNLDYKNSKIGIWSKVGNQKVLVKRKDFQKELELTITLEKNIVVVNIDESVSASFFKTNSENVELLRGFVIGLSSIYILAIVLLTLFADYSVNSAYNFIFLLIFLISVSLPKNKMPFDLKVKNI